MSELQLGLIGAGGIAVLAVLAYNKWQERRHRKLAEQMLAHRHADVLLGGDRHEAPPFPAAPAGDADADEPHAAPPAPVERTAKSARHEPARRVEPMLVADDSALPHHVVDAADDAPAAVESVAETADIAIDASHAGAPAEPVVTRAAAVAPAPTPPPPWEEMPAAAPVPPASAAEPRAPAADDEVPAGLVSPAIEYVAAIELVEPASGGQILRSQHALLARVAKPVGWAGYNERTREWERVGEEGSYRRLRVGLLLADRRGPLGEADLLTFHGAMKNLADELLAVADLPPRDAALDAAIALDRFCANVDIVVGLNVVSQGQVFPGTKIRALTEAAGMVLDASGRFVRSDDDGHILYTLANQETAGFSAAAMRSMNTHGLVFTLDVPRVAHGDRVFAQMLELARRMAETLHGVLVDDNRRPLSEAMLDPFRRQIGQYQAQLAAHGLPAGGPLALRLFS